MGKYIFSVSILISINTQYLICSSTVNVTVQREENSTLTCNINSSSGLAWYQQRSERMILLLSASRGNIHKDLLIDYNEDASRFDILLETDTKFSSVGLVIIGVRESDLGLYYCAARIKGMLQFGTAIRLTFADAKEEGFIPAAVSISCSVVVVMCACAACGFCGILCACVLCQKQAFSSVSCVKGNPDLKASQVQYASLRYIRRAKAAVPVPVDVQL